MRNIILVALIIAFATLVGCKEEAKAPASSSMSSMEQPKENMEKAPEAAQEPAAAPDAPAGGEAPASAQ